MFLTYIFDTKIINRQCELNRSCNMPPKSWCVCKFVVSFWSKDFWSYEFARVPYCGNPQRIYMSIYYFLLHIILVNNVLRKQTQGHFNIFILIHGRSQIKCSNVEPHKFRVFCAEDTDLQNLSCGQTRRSSSEITIIIDEIYSCYHS